MSRPLPQQQSRRERRAQARVDRPAPPRKKIVRRAPAQRRTWQSPLVLTSIGALIVGAVLIFAASGFKLGGDSALAAPLTSYTGLPVNGESVGSANAPVVMEVFSDFQCPVCKQFYETELPGLLKDLVEPGLLRIEAKDIDIIDSHKSGSTESLDLAAGGFCAAQQNLYWEYHDYVFWNQGGENTGYHSKAFIDRVATAAGLDMTAFDTCFARTDIRQPIIDATSAAAAQGVQGTPTVRLNGQLLSGVPSLDQLKSVILQLAARATSSPAPSVSPASSASSAAPASAVPSAVPSPAPS